MFCQTTYFLVLLLKYTDPYIIVIIMNKEALCAEEEIMVSSGFSFGVDRNCLW